MDQRWPATRPSQAARGWWADETRNPCRDRAGALAGVDPGGAARAAIGGAGTPLRGATAGARGPADSGRDAAPAGRDASALGALSPRGAEHCAPRSRRRPDRAVPVLTGTPDPTDGLAWRPS